MLLRIIYGWSALCDGGAFGKDFYTLLFDAISIICRRRVA